MKMKLSEIEMDDSIYPRQRISPETIDSYVEALKAGAKFPAIKVQKIKEGENVKTIVLDGYHRLEAHRKYNKLKDIEPVKEIEITFWKDEILDKREQFEELLSEATNLNRKHGFRLADSDLKSVCEKIIENRPLDKLVGIQKELAVRFGVSEAWISKNVGEKVLSRRSVRDIQIYTMSKKGSTHEEVAEQMGISRAAVTKIVKKFTKQESSGIVYDRELADFFTSFNLIEVLHIGLVVKLMRAGWEREEIVTHLKLKELSEAICESYEGIWKKAEEIQKIIRKGVELAGDGGAKIGDAVSETTAKINSLLAARVKEIERETLEGLR